MQKSVVCYASGHGFGHAARTCAVLRELRSRRPEVEIVIRSPLARWFFDFNLGTPLTYGACRLDIGVVQPDSLAADLEATARAYGAIDAAAVELVQAEMEAVRPHRPALVFADIPALAFDLAAELGVPGVAMTNFSWDWIYADYARDVPAFAPLVERLRGSYGRATLLLRLPLHGDLGAFPSVRDIPLVARRASIDRDAARARLALPNDERIVLLSFGGLGLSLDSAPRLDGVRFVSTGGAMLDRSPDGVRTISHAELTATGLRYEDLVGACDAVMTKPGYGIVAECIANATPMIYTPRGRFAEYEVLVAGVEAHLPNACIDNQDLRAGRWQAAIQNVLAQPRRPVSLPVDGAAVAADVLAAML